MQREAKRANLEKMCIRDRGSMVNCSKCGHDFLCDRDKLIPKKPFAKAKKAVSVHSPKDRREAIQSALVYLPLLFNLFPLK